MNEAETLEAVPDEVPETPEGEVANDVTAPPANDVTAKPDNDNAEAKAQEKSAARFAALARQEAKTRQEREQARLERESMQRERAELDAYRSKLQRIKNENPLEALQEAGISYEELTRRIINDGKPSVEHELAELKQWKTEFLKQQQEQAETARRQASEMSIGQAKQAFAGFVTTSDDFPFLASYEPNEIADAGWQVANRLFEQTQEAPSQEDIAKYLEEQLETRYNRGQERRAAKQAKVGQSPAPNGALSQEGTKQAVRGNGTEANRTPTGTRTLTNAAAAERSTVPANFDELPEREQDELMAKFIREHGWRKTP